MEVIPSSRIELLAEMEERYEKKDKEYFVQLLDHKDYVIRTRAVCILVDFGGEEMVTHVSKILKNDSNELVRHEAAIALGVIGSQDAKATLQNALSDPSEPVRESAVVALSNLHFMEKLSKNERFAKLTGG